MHLKPGRAGCISARLDASTGAPGPHDFAVRDRPRHTALLESSVWAHESRWTEMGCRAQHTLADWSWSPLLGSMRMSRRGEIEPSSAVQISEPFAEERASRRRKIINKIMNVIVVVGIAIDLFFAILYSVLDPRAYAIAIGVNLATAALWALTPLFHRWPGPYAGVWFLGVLMAAMLSFTLLLGHASGSHLFYSRRDLFADLPGPSSDCATAAHDPGRLGSVRRRGQGFASLAIPHPDVDR